MPQTPNPEVVADDEVIEVAWGNSVVNIIGNIASLALGSGNGAIANRLFDIMGVNAGQQTQINRLDVESVYSAYGEIVNVTTNAQGAANINFPAGLFAGGVVVMADNPDNALGNPANWLDVRAYATTTSGFQVQVAQRGQSFPHANVAILVRWLALGPRP